MSRLTIIGLAACMLASIGCSPIPMASPERDALAKTFAVSPGKSNIYVYRMLARGIASVELDGAPAGQTVDRTFLLLEVAPGKHTLVSKFEETPDAALDVQAEPGKNYFVLQDATVKKGWGWSFEYINTLKLIDEETGKSQVGEARLVEKGAPAGK